ncbi:MAG: phosphoribosyltransferase family protein, partial [Patescibacteria group bacterium]
NNVILLDPHSPNNLAHLKKAGIKTTCLSALNIFVQRFQPKLKNKKDWLVLCLDKGAQKRSRAFAQKLKLPMARLKKSRDLSSGKVTFKDFTRDLRNKNIISFDDFVSTGQSRVKAAKLVKKIGAKTYIDCITHGLLGPGASDNLQKSSINQIFLTDSYPIPPKKRFPKLKILTCAHLLARAIQKLA